jgi:hypothetical protein
MSEKILGEAVTFRIEVEENPKGVLLVFDRKCDYCVIPWQDAHRLADLMDQVIADVRAEFVPTLYGITMFEQAQIKLAHHKGLVALLVEWTDRIRFTSLDALYLVGQALRKEAQDSHLELRGVRFVYDKQGMIRKIINRDYTQEVR